MKGNLIPMRSACVGLVLLISGCAAYGNKKITDPTIVAQIEKGKSTKADVKGILGDPATVDFSDTGVEKWIYAYTKHQTRGATFIPVVGMLAGGADIKTDTLIVQFDKDGTVMNVGSGQSTGGGGGLQDVNR